MLPLFQLLQGGLRAEMHKRRHSSHIHDMTKTLGPSAETKEVKNQKLPSEEHKPIPIEEEEEEAEAEAIEVNAEIKLELTPEAKPVEIKKEKLSKEDPKQLTEALELTQLTEKSTNQDSNESGDTSPNNAGGSLS